MSIKNLAYLCVGMVFGLTLIKSEVASRWRIQEMFQFQSFHMYGVIGSAVVLTALLFRWIRTVKPHALTGKEITIPPKTRHQLVFVAGLTFGVGWAMIGACPGPIYALVGAGYWSVLVVLAGAVVGTLLAGRVRARYT